MPAISSSIIEPIWSQFEALIPPVQDEHPLGCHRPRVADRVVFDKLVQVLVLGAAYEKIADTTCSATTIRRRRDEWIAAGIFTALEQISLESYDRYCALDLEDLVVDGCLVKAPCGGEAAGRSPVDRGKQGTKRSLLTEGSGISAGHHCGRGELPRLTSAAPDSGNPRPVRVLSPGGNYRAPRRRLRLDEDPGSARRARL